MEILLVNLFLPELGNFLIPADLCSTANWPTALFFVNKTLVSVETMKHTDRCRCEKFYSLVLEESCNFRSSGSAIRLAVFHYRRAAFSSQINSKVGNILVKAACLRVTLNIDGTPIASRSHIHPSPSQTSRLLRSSLLLGVPVPLTT